MFYQFSVYLSAVSIQYILFSGHLAVSICDFFFKSNNWYCHDKSCSEGNRVDTITNNCGLQLVVKEPIHIFDNSSSCINLWFASKPNLRIHWRLLTILETSNKSVWNNVFWYVKVCIFWKCIQYAIHRDKTQILKKFPSDKINGTKNVLSFLSRAPTHCSFTFNLRFLSELKHKVRLFKTVCEIFHFQLRSVFTKVYIFIQQNTWTLSL